MLYLITGASGSGKSEYAELLAAKLADKKRGDRLYYVATMLPRDDEETRTRIERHRKQRGGKGFYTIECPYRLDKIIDEYNIDEHSVVLLECMSNLLANEMFEETASCSDKHNRIIDGMIVKACLKIAGKAKALVIVTNEIFSDGGSYDGLTEEYVRLLGIINSGLTREADAAVEVVCGIPVFLKTKENCND